MQQKNIRIGYACLNPDLHRSFKTCRFDSLTTEKWIELIDWNLSVLEDMVNYTIHRNIGLLRISGDLIPFATKAKQGVNLNWQEFFAPQLRKISETIKANNLRISMHPGQYTVINSPIIDVVERSIADLEYHAELLELLGGNQTNKMIIHIGGVYGDKDAAIKRFIVQANQLSDRVRRHLVIENDERLFSIVDLLTISQHTNLPVIFDNLHHQVKIPHDKTPIREYILQAGETWSRQDGRQKMHYSQQALEKKAGAHSETIAIDAFMEFCDQLADISIDIMLEVKDKNRSAEKIQLVLDQDIKAAERLWSIRKYSVLAKSANIYQQIRELLNEKQQMNYQKFINLLEKAEVLAEDRGAEINTAQHIWGYFKNLVAVNEFKSYEKIIVNYQEKSINNRQLRQFFKRLLRKYPNNYLIDSLYFYE